MTDFDIDLIVQGAEDRGEQVAPILPKANWISLEGNFTPDELRALASKVERSFKKGKEKWL